MLAGSGLEMGAKDSVRSARDVRPGIRPDTGSARDELRLVLITQDDPFFLAENLEYLFSHLPHGVSIVGCVVSDASPFGRRESFLQKARKTRRVFGNAFFLRYATRFVLARLNPHRQVLRVLRRHRIERIDLDGSINSERSLEQLRIRAPDLLVSIAGNELFKKRLISLAPKGCLNLHTALLPKYRGLMPTFWVLKNREKETGVSVFFVDEGIDSGPILVQRRVEIGDMTQEQLIRRTKRLGMDAILEALEKVRRGNLDTVPNDDSQKTYFSFPTRDDVREFRKAGARFY